MEVCLQRWKFTNRTTEVPEPKPNLEQYNQICEDWQAKDKVAKLLGMFSSHKLFEDWCVAELEETTRKTSTWTDFVAKMKVYYKPTENITLKHFNFRALSQQQDENFPRFCNRVQAEAKHCQLKCIHADCTAEEMAVRDQIIIGTTNDAIRDDALKKSWDLLTLRSEGMKMESAARGGVQISGQSSSVNKLGAYSYTNLKKKKTEYPTKRKYNPLTCFNCGVKVFGSILKHREQCNANNHKCQKCYKKGHFENACKSTPVKRVNTEKNEDSEEAEEIEEQVHNINIFTIKKSKNSSKPKFKANIENKNDFKVQLVINNHLDHVIADTGAYVSVCGTAQIKKWGMLDRLMPSKLKIKPYNSPAIPVYGEARCSVTFGPTSVPVVWHVIIRLTCQFHLKWVARLLCLF